MTREVEARLRISAVDKTGQVLKGVASKMDEVNRRAAALNRQQGAMARGSQAAFGLVARYAAPAAMAFAAKAALVDFAALDRQMTRIGNTAGASAEETRTAFATMQTESKQLALPLDSAVTALDTLVSSGLSLKEAMDFLPSVLATTQASGADVTDIANTGLKTASAFKIQAGDMQHAFDLMVASGQSGQFELKDMAVYIPSLANAFARLGYRGEDGLKRLMAALQTVREDTGTAEEAANDVANVFQKMGSRETISNFKKFGVDLTAEMDKAKKKGEDTLDAFVRLSNQAVKGDLTKLPQLFSDKQVLDGMTSLITSTDRLTHYYGVLNETSIDGTVARNNIRLLNDTQASIDKLSYSYEKLKASAGGAIAKVAVPVMDQLSKSIDYNSAITNDSEQQGHGFWSKDQWLEPLRGYAAAMGFDSARRSQDQRAYRGGYRDPEWLKKYWADNAIEVSGPDAAADRSRSSPAVARLARGAVSLGSPSASRARHAWPSPSPTPPAGAPSSPRLPPIEGLQPRSAIMDSVKSFFRLPSKEEFRDALKIDLKPSADEASQSIADGGKKAGDSISESAAKLIAAGVEIGATINSAIISASKAVAANATRSSQADAKVNADVGRTMPPSVTGGGGGGF